MNWWGQSDIFVCMGCLPAHLGAGALLLVLCLLYYRFAWYSSKIHVRPSVCLGTIACLLWQLGEKTVVKQRKKRTKIKIKNL